MRIKCQSEGKGEGTLGVAAGHAEGPDRFACKPRGTYLERKKAGGDLRNEKKDVPENTSVVEMKKKCGHGS